MKPMPLELQKGGSTNIQFVVGCDVKEFL